MCIRDRENIIIRFTDVGHLLGSACIEAWLTEGGAEKKIVFSGDIVNTDQPIIRDPQTVSGADYVLLISSTRIFWSIRRIRLEIPIWWT